MDKDFVNSLKDCSSIPDIFEVVKEAVWKTVRKSRAGLELGLVELGNKPDGLLGAYYVTGSNIIIMNETPLNRIQETNPELVTPYIFSILLHEYLHSLGYFDEELVKNTTHDISCKVFGKSSVIAQISADMAKFFPNLIYPQGAPNIDAPVKIVQGFDRSSIRYIG
ncbi:MAG: hypothetical protein V1678_02085 [Candidatus Aenigmatarchaeota archaeon]